VGEGVIPRFETVVEEVLYPYPGLSGSHDYRIRAGMVFSTGSIAFSQSLPYNNFDNDISKVLANVVDPFSSKTKLPGWAWSAEDK
jgi:N,N-dimethylformamidase